MVKETPYLSESEIDMNGLIFLFLYANVLKKNLSRRRLLDSKDLTWKLKNAANVVRIKHTHSQHSKQATVASEAGSDVSVQTRAGGC